MARDNLMKNTVLCLIVISFFLVFARDSKTDELSLSETIKNEFSIYPEAVITDANQYIGSAQIHLYFGDYLILNVKDYYEKQIEKNQWIVKDEIIEQGTLIFMLAKNKRSASIVISSNDNVTTAIITMFDRSISMWE